MDKEKLHTLGWMGLDCVWSLRKTEKNNDQRWLSLSETVSSCQKCSLCQTRKQTVLGVGDRQARWLFVGEAPGEHEDNQGEPFVGQAGQLLDAILSALNLNRTHDVYIANALKCRPPHNRTPTLSEIETCLPYLQEQIALISPQVIVTLGRPATQALLGDVSNRLGDMRGHRYSYQNIPLVVTYHPAYLLRSPSEKKKVWEDLLFAQSLLASSTKGVSLKKRPLE